MSQLQYVGARYVPIWYENTDDQSADWQPNVEYEPLTFVTTTNNHLYLSKKEVPDTIGNPANNISYWLDMGVFTNAQISQLQQEVNDMKDGDVPGSLQNQIDIMNDGSSVGSLQNQINGMKDGSLAGSLQNQINGIKAAEPFNTFNVGYRKCIFIGDSYCDNNRGGATNGVYTRFCTSSGFSDGVNSKLYHKGGAGFMGNGQGKTFGDLLNDAISDAFFNADEVTDIVVAGGCNDQNFSISQINTAKDTFIGNVRTSFPNARVFLAMCGGFINAERRNYLMHKVKAVYDANPAADVIPIMNAHVPMMNAACFDTDGTHPIGTGVVYMGVLIGTAVKNIAQIGHLTYADSLDFTVVRTNGTGSVIGKIIMDYKGMRVQPREGAGPTFTNPVAITFNNGALFELGTVTNGSNFLPPNAINTTDAPFWRYPCGMWINESSTFLYIAGELLGVAASDNSYATWYFKSNSSPKNMSVSQLRFASCEIVLS